MMRGMNMQQMMKQAKAMQKKMMAEHEELAKQEFVGKAPDDMVTATFSGDNQLIDLTMQTGILGTGINDNIGIVDGTLHSEAEALLEGINQSKDALVDLLTSINKNLTEEEAQQIID